MSPIDHSWEGRCHCGAIGFTFRSSQAPALWSINACQCTFCRGHGARTIADASGSVTFAITDASKLERYRFGLRTADFLICRACGVYLAAVLSSARGQFATLNANTIRGLSALPAAAPATYDGESATQRQDRREARWTPVTPPI